MPREAGVHRPRTATRPLSAEGRVAVVAVVVSTRTAAAVGEAVRPSDRSPALAPVLPRFPVRTVLRRKRKCHNLALRDDENPLLVIKSMIPKQQTTIL